MLPLVADAMWSLGNVSRFRAVEKRVNDFDVVETLGDPIVFQGILQPISQQRLMVKPEGQRQWKYWVLWTRQELALDYIVEDSGYKRYRVMSVRDWSEAGYHEYELTEAPRKAGT